MATFTEHRFDEFRKTFNGLSKMVVEAILGNVVVGSFSLEAAYVIARGLNQKFVSQSVNVAGDGI
jgi:hypothetical protein